MRAFESEGRTLEEDLASFVRSASVPFSVLDADCRYTFVNEAMARLNHLAANAHFGRSIEDVAPDVAHWTREAVAKVIATGTTVTETMVHADRPAFVVTLFPFHSADALTSRIGVVCVPTRLVEDGPTANWRRRLSFEALLSTIAAQLLAAPSERFDESIRDALGAICESQEFARASVVRFEGPGGRIAITYEWHRSEIAPTSGALPVFEVFGKTSVGDALRAREPALIVASELPDAVAGLRSYLEALRIPAIYVFPLLIEGEIRGAVTFAMRSVDPLGNDVTRRLRLASDVLANAFVRNEKDRALRAAYEEVARLKTAVENERDYLREEIDRELGGSEVVHASDAMRKVFELASAVARTPATVLVRGESGVGKELIARAIHHASERRDGPLVKVNCASIPRELFESEFFGHARGAFTGALRDRVGRFELANGGTLFLDEIGEIPPAEQAKLLRVIQEGEFERVGEDRTRRVDVRIVAATNRRLERDVAEGRFRRDLYFRLNVFPIEVPPLRERLDDVIPLAEHFVRVQSIRLGRRNLMLSDADRATLLAYAWPGNVRELMHVIERSIILSGDTDLRLRLPDVPPPPSVRPPAPAFHAHAIPPAAPSPAARTVKTVAELRALEISMIEEALSASGGRVSGKGGAAERLGLSPSTLRDRMKALGIRRTD